MHIHACTNARTHLVIEFLGLVVNGMDNVIALNDLQVIATQLCGIPQGRDLRILYEHRHAQLALAGGQRWLWHLRSGSQRCCRYHIDASDEALWRATDEGTATQ